MTKSQTTPRIANGPQTLCWCGAISNHVTGLCATHREPMLTDGDRAYLEWKKQRGDSDA